VTGRHAPAHAAVSAFDLGVVNTPVDLEAIVERLAGWRPGTGPGVSLCLYGPPGTGKSEFVRHLGRRMGRRVVERRVSDLASCWVGQTEKAIAAAFCEAERDGAVLLFDEVDSYLRDRRGARHGWEVTEVNEFLSQLERCGGVVACTTNLIADLDPASLRRFAFKIPFHYLDAERAVRLFRNVFEPTLVEPVDEVGEIVLRAEFSRGTRLAAGDFAAVARRVRLLGRPMTVADLLAELRLELAARQGAPSRAGFACA
jgi:SpoVK/Ycf46/Vps4 family AAA+-type ATPase